MESYDSCDESKCISGRSSESRDWGPFVCYGDEGPMFPMMCADGFLPVVVEDEPSILTTAWTWDGFQRYDSERKVPVQYFTCCPPDHNTSSPDEGDSTTSVSNVTRHCSDPIGYDNEIPETACEDQEERKFPIRTKSDFFLCCDSNSTNRTQTFIEETECVPYQNEKYFAATIGDRNEIGDALIIYCDFPRDGFVFPRPFGNGTIEDVVSTQQYQCCKTGPPLPHFVKDSTFVFENYTLLILCSLSAILSFMVILGLSIPLLEQLATGRYRSPTTTSPRPPMRRRWSRKNIPSYSTYNLYLVYLAIPDFLCNLSGTMGIILLLNMKAPFWFPRTMTAIAYFGLTANLWLNAIVLYQVMLMVESLKRAQRINQPSLRRVSLQAGAVYCLAIAGCVLMSFFDDRAGMGRTTRGTIFWSAYIIVAFVPPIVYGVYANILVCRGGYLRARAGMTAAADEAMWELAVYFFRIVCIFVGVWVPVLVLSLIAGFYGKPWADWVFSLGYPFQSIATFCAILTKTDARTYILDMVTLYGIFGGCGGDNETSTNEASSSDNDDNDSGNTGTHKV